MKVKEAKRLSRMMTNYRIKSALEPIKKSNRKCNSLPSSEKNYWLSIKSKRKITLPKLKFMEDD